MNKKLLFSGILVATIIATSSNANADFFGWFKGSNTESDNTENWSFERLFSSIQNAPVQPSISISQDSSVLALSDITSSTKRIETSKPKTFVVSASAYSSTPDQTDSTPFITASNTFVRDGVVATNFLPIGTRIRIPALFGDKQFIVEDRMNSRYWYNIDIWFADRETALDFGRKQVVIEIVS